MELMMSALGLIYLCVLLFALSLAFRFVTAVERMAGTLDRWAETAQERKL